MVGAECPFKGYSLCTKCDVGHILVNNSFCESTCLTRTTCSYVTEGRANPRISFQVQSTMYSVHVLSTCTQYMYSVHVLSTCTRVVESAENTSTGTDWHWHWVRHWVNTVWHWVKLQLKFTHKPVKTWIFTKTSAIPVPKHAADAALALERHWHWVGHCQWHWHFRRP